MSNVYRQVLRLDTSLPLNVPLFYTLFGMIEVQGIHLEKDMSVPFGHTVARTVCLFEIVCAPIQLNVPFFKLYVPQISVMKCINESTL